MNETPKDLGDQTEVVLYQSLRVLDTSEDLFQEFLIDREGLRGHFGFPSFSFYVKITYHS
jgi:hypothetical protein